jgi:beta-lactamase class A
MTSLQSLEAELRRIGAGYSGTWTCALTDLTTGEHIAIDEDAVMPTASLIKTPILVALYQAVHDGKRSLTDRIRYGLEHISLGSGVLQYLDPGVELSVRDAAVLMMMISDNAATNMCIDLAGLDRVNEEMRKRGLDHTELKLRLGDERIGMEGRNMAVSSAADIVRLLTSLERHECVSPEADEDMLRIMRRCQGRAELSRLLPWNELNMLPRPRENWVAEKGGSFTNGVRTSGAIFHGPHATFVMSVFCEGGLAGGTASNAEGNELLGKLGLAAWRALAADIE